MSMPQIEKCILARNIRGRIHRLPFKWYNPNADMCVDLDEDDYANMNDLEGDHNVCNMDLCHHIWDTHYEQTQLQM